MLTSGGSFSRDQRSWVHQADANIYDVRLKSPYNRPGPRAEANAAHRYRLTLIYRLKVNVRAHPVVVVGVVVVGGW